MVLKIKQRPNSALLRWILLVGSVYLYSLTVIAVAYIGSFSSLRNSSGMWLLLPELLCGLLEGKHCSGFPGHLAAGTDAVSCCEEEQNFRRLALPCDISGLKTLDAYKLVDVGLWLFFSMKIISVQNLLCCLYFRSHFWASLYPTAT